MGNYLGRAGAYALHKRYPAGSQTAAQLQAERNNQIKARAARGEYRHTGSATYHGLRKPSSTGRGSIAAGRTYRMSYLRPDRFRTVNVRYIRYRKMLTIRKIRITGLHRKFRSRIGPGRYLGRTAWGASRSPHFKKRASRRQRRFRTISRWKGRGKRFTPK